MHPIEIKKTTSPSKQFINVFSVLDIDVLQRGNGAVLCMYKGFLPLERENFAAPI
ncbi:MAG: hypothetical protein LBU32_00505 [Clostridiales bacterium]|nr:hypothetical protein [Clostridiales bacterium]